MMDDKPQHECGVFGIYAPDEDVARLTFFGLYSLQHRGQESAGIAVSNGRRINLHKEMGLVAQVFDENSLRPLQGHLAIGHTRYSTTGSSKLQNAQPFVVESALGPLAVGHNGNLTNAHDLRQELLNRGVGLTSSSDSEVITQMLEVESRCVTGIQDHQPQRVLWPFSALHGQEHGIHAGQALHRNTPLVDHGFVAAITYPRLRFRQLLLPSQRD